MKKESGITQYILTPGQIELVWDNFGGSCAEISRFLGDILMRAEHGKVPDTALEDELRKVSIQVRSMFVDYASLYKDKRALFRNMSMVVSAKRVFREDDLANLVDSGTYEIKTLREELINLVRHNFLAYNPVTAEFSVQGRSMEIGLAMYVELMQMSAKQ